jgi:uncharacterized protein (DUF3084 family)
LNACTNTPRSIASSSLSDRSRHRRLPVIACNHRSHRARAGLPAVVRVTAVGADSMSLILPH